MSLFVEVNSIEKGCPVIINLDHIVEIAPLIDGGCALFMVDNAGMNSKSALRVSDSYDQFKQFAMQTVTAEDIAARFPKTKKEVAPVSDLLPGQKNTKSKPSESIEIPKL
jgi:hypothetical protein